MEGECECTSDEHWDLLKKLTVLLFTRDRPREVARLLRSLVDVPCFVAVYDNGLKQLPQELRTVSDRQSYTYRPGHWAHNLKDAASQLNTEFVCLVDDDGLLQPRGAAKALCRLIQEREAVAVEGQCANFVVREGSAFLLKFTDAADGASSELDPILRWRSVLDNFSEASFYAIHRSWLFSRTFGLAADVELIATSRNVSPPIFIAMTAAYGQICRSSSLLSLREDSLPSHHQAAMDLWIGDWLADRKYQVEVDQVLTLTRQSLVKSGMSLGDASKAVNIFLETMGRLAHVQPSIKIGPRATLARVTRPLRNRIRMGTTSPPEEILQNLREKPRITRTELNALSCPTILDLGKIHWDSEDAQQTLLALAVDGAIVVDRPRELRNQAYIHSRQT